jgi:hypothetical protein
MEVAMAINQDKSTIVVRGDWNPAIISPQWLLKYKVVESPPTNLGLITSAAGNRITFLSDKVTWVIDSTRLELRAREPVDLGSYAARLLGLLPHTPIRAIGVTFYFLCPVDKWPEAALPTLGDIRLTPRPAYPDLQQIQWSCIRKFPENTRLQLTLTQEGENVVITLNFHRITTQASVAAEYAGRWSDHAKVATTVIKDMFGVEI